MATTQTEKVEKQTNEPRRYDTSGWDEHATSVDGFYSPEVTGRIIGKVLEDFEIDGDFGRQSLVKVKLLEPATAVLKDNEEKRLDVGQVIAVRVSAGLTGLLDLVKNQCLLELVPTGKIKVKRGQMWQYKVRSKGERVKYQGVPRVSRDGKEDEDLPF